MKVKLYIRHANSIERQPLGDIDLAVEDPLLIVRKWGIADEHGETHGVGDGADLDGQIFHIGEDAGFEIIYGI